MTTGAASKGFGTAVLAVFQRHGYGLAEPGVLQPAGIFLEVSGEDLRKRMFMTQDSDGREMCLRPEFTIPVCRDHLAKAQTGEAGSYSYLGPVFRMRTGETGEFWQAGIESLGRSDKQAADAEVLTLTCEALAEAGLTQPDIHLGDVALLKAMIRGLNVASAPARRLLRAVSAGGGAGAVAALDVAAPRASAAQAGLIAALQGQDPKAARGFVEDVLSIAGISSVGGRTAGDIASRFLARASEQQVTSPEVRAIMSQMLAIHGDPDDSAAALRKLAGAAGLDLDAELDAFEARIGFIAARGLDVGAMRFSASFARNLDYYTSFIFEVHDPAVALASSTRPHVPAKPVAGGGRYDTLLGKLGAAEAMPAVGASIWLDRLARRLA